ncbi:MAG: hypothetical protein ABI661_02170 [Gammaproteobacteria bacterium]
MRKQVDPTPTSSTWSAFETAIVIVSEDEPGEWRVADRRKDEVHGPFADEASATAAAIQCTDSRGRWELHVLDRFGTLVSCLESAEDQGDRFAACVLQRADKG